MSLVIAGMNITCMVDSLGRYELPDWDCSSSLIAKALGYAIIAASTVVKLPQILVIIRSNSIKGLSVASFEMELVGYTIALSYCLFRQLPFSAYGELLFLLLQAFILVGLLYFYSPKLGPSTWVKAGVYSAVAPLLLGGKLDAKAYEGLYAGQTALFTASRVPQIWANLSSRSTGQLSLATTFMNFAGCLVRLFTYIQEGAPVSMIVGSILGMICHGTLVAQILAYNLPSKKDENEKNTKDKKSL